MTIIQLQPGDRYDTGQPAAAFSELVCEVLTKQKRSIPMQLELRGADLASAPEPGAAETRITENKLKLRNLTGTVRVLVAPGKGASSFPHDANAEVSYLLRGKIAADNTELQLPRYKVAGLSSFPLCTLSGESGTVVIEVNQQLVGVELDDLSSRVRSALCSTVGTDSLPADVRRPCTLVVDASASMSKTTPPEALKAIYTLACGVLSVVSQGKTITVATSAGDESVLESSADIAELAQRRFAYDEVGFRLKQQPEEGEAIVVISDDLPASLAHHNGPIHLLTTRTPVGRADISYTLFTPSVCDAITSGDTTSITNDLHDMARTLVGGKI